MAPEADCNDSSTVPTPHEALEIEDPRIEDEVVYPTGIQLWISIVSILLSVIFVGLDMTIVAVAVPRLTNQFKTVADIGWYSAAYTLIYSSFTFLFSKVYRFFPIKRIFIISTVIFELGSLLCTVAPTSAVFILGRAVAGLGSSGLAMGGLIIVTHIFPAHKRPMWSGAIGATQFIAMVIAPLIGGALVDSFSWRACFGINLPIGALTLLFTWYSFRDPVENPDTKLPLLEKLKKMDPIATCFFIPAVVCLLIALQWGGSKYSWKTPIIIVLFILFGCLTSVFGYIQYRQKEDATIPPRIIKQRSIIAAAWFSACCNGVLAVTEYYLSIYFQGVRGFSAVKSGAMGLPLMVGLCIAALVAGFLTTRIGYFYPFMFATSVLAPIATGLLTTINFEENIIIVLVFVGILGGAVGLGNQTPLVAVQTILPVKDVPTGLALVGFAGGLGSALFISVSATLFQNRLADEEAKYAPGINMTVFGSSGLADIRDNIGQAGLKNALMGYDKAVTQTLYLPVALASLTVFASLAMERKSIKKKS